MEEKRVKGVWKKGTYRWTALRHPVSNDHLNYVRFEADLTTARTSRLTAGGFSATWIH